METWMVFFVVGVVFAAAAAVAWVVVGRSRSAGLKRKFGTEYEHAVQASGSRSRGEADLASRTKRVETLDIRQMSAGDHVRFAERWRSVQAYFVDNPTAAVSDAEKLVEEVMRPCAPTVSTMVPISASLAPGATTRWLYTNTARWWLVLWTTMLDLKLAMYGDESIKALWQRLGIQLREPHRAHRWQDIPEVCKDCRDWQTAGTEYQEESVPGTRPFWYNENTKEFSIVPGKGAGNG